MAEEWVDHSLDLAREAKNRLEAADKAHSNADKKLKETLAQLTEVEKTHRNAEFALKGYEKQAADALKAQKKAENKIALTVVELKQTKKQLKVKEAEKSQAKQAAYDAGMTKVAKSLTAQLRDVARAFCLEVWGQALNAVGVSTESELRAPDKVYYPLHCIWHPLSLILQQIPALFPPSPQTSLTLLPLLPPPKTRSKSSPLQPTWWMQKRRK